MNFELGAPYCGKTPFFIRGTIGIGTQEINTEAYYFKVKVTNEGKSQARLCEALISELQMYKDKKWQLVDNFQEVNLKWAVAKQEDPYININPSMSRLIDVGLIIRENLQDKPTDVFWIDYLYRIGGYQPEYLEPKKRYRFKIIVASENTKAIGTFELIYTGIWKIDPSDMYKEITIQMK